MAELVKKGKEMISLADNALNSGYFWLACFLYHQGVELILKGLLEMTKGSHPFTHDLEKLISEFENVPNEVKEAAINLTPHYIAARYSLSSTYTKAKAENCKKQVEVILRWLKI